MALVNFKRDFFDRDGKYYTAGTHEYNGPTEDKAGNPLLPSDAVVVEGAALPFQQESPIPKPGFGAKPLEEQVLDMIPGAGDDHQIHSAGGAPAVLTDEQMQQKLAAVGTTAPADEDRKKADEELAASIAEAAPKAEAAAEVVKETVDPLSIFNDDSKPTKKK